MYRNMQTDQSFVWNYIGNWCVFLIISICIPDIDFVQMSLFSKTSPLYFNLFFKGFYIQKTKQNKKTNKQNKKIKIKNNKM